MTLTDTAADLLGLVIVAGVATKVLDSNKEHNSKKKKEEKPFKW